MREATRAVVKWAVMATVLTGFVVPLSVLSNGAPLMELASPGTKGPSVEVFHQDFPGVGMHPGSGHDGQQFYAIARNPLHPDQVAPHLDRPRYRLQRIAYPFAAWLLHPSGGGAGLVVAMLAVGIAAVLVGCLATGFLSVRWGGPPWAAALFALVPGNLVALRMSTADTMALAFVVAAIALAEHDRHRLALVAGSIGVLSKEAALVVLIAYAIGRRDRRGLLLAAVPFGVAAAWAAWLRIAVEASGRQVVEFTLPFAGIARAAGHWSRGEESSTAFVLAATVLLVAFTLLRRRDRMTRALVGVPAAFVTCLSADATGIWGNFSRITAPVVLFALLALVARQRPAAPGAAAQVELAGAGSAAGAGAAAAA